MTKFHIKRDGTPGICYAEKGKCPLGGDNVHFPTREAAQQAADERNAESNELFMQNQHKNAVLKGRIFDSVSPKMQKIIILINKNGGTVYFVGGCVRDKFLGRENKDVDVEIHNIPVQKVRDILTNFGNVDEVGKAFGVLKVDGVNTDFTFPRTESRTGDRHTDFDVKVNPFLSLHASALRRDFTMNALMEEAETGKVIDQFGGIQDLANRKIRFVDKKTFADDSLRVFRAAQFASRFNMTIDDEVINLGKTLDFSKLSIERVETELHKGFMSDHPSVMLSSLKKMNVFKQLSPNIEKMSSVEQNLEWHPEGNVWNHTMQVVDTAAKLKDSSSEPFSFMVGSFVHDVGKVETTVKDPVTGKITAHNHAEVGADMVHDTLSRLIKNKSVIRSAKNLTKFHMVGHDILTMRSIKVRRFMLNHNVKDILLFNICDNSKGNRNLQEAKESAEFDKKVARVRSLEQGAPFKIIPEVQGRDLINIGLKPSKEFKDILDRTLEWQLEGRSKSSVLKSVKKLYGDKE